MPVTEYDLNKPMPWGEYHGLRVEKEGEPRKFCGSCRKMIRPGQQYYYESRGIPFRRINRETYWHYPDCPEHK